MKELKELRLNGSTLILDQNRVLSPIIPQTYKDMGNEILVKGETFIDGAVYTRKLEIVQGPFTVLGAFFSKESITVQTSNETEAHFKKAVACGGAINMINSGRKYFGADLNGQVVNLKNAIVAANVFASEVTLDNCVVLGGVFGTKKTHLINTVVGTFNAPSVALAGDVFMLYPSAFSVEPIHLAQDAHLFNLTLADLGNLMKGLPENAMSGMIEIIPSVEGQKIRLKDKKGNETLWETYSIAGKVLAADILDLKHLDNHFMLSIGSLGEQLVKRYDFGCDKNGKPLELTLESIGTFLADIQRGTIHVKTINGSVSFEELKRFYSD